MACSMLDLAKRVIHPGATRHMLDRMVERQISLTAAKATVREPDIKVKTPEGWRLVKTVDGMAVCIVANWCRKTAGYVLVTAFPLTPRQLAALA